MMHKSPTVATATARHKVFSGERTSLFEERQRKG